MNFSYFRTHPWRTLAGSVLALLVLIGVLMVKASVEEQAMVRAHPDYADRDFDRHVERTKERPLTAGKVTTKEALALFAALSLCAFGLVLLLGNALRWVASPEGAQWEIKREKEWPMIGASIDLVEKYNLYSVQQNSGAITPGIVIGYSLDSPWSGGSLAPIQVIDEKTLI